jgi:hypothetical protein
VGAAGGSRFWRDGFTGAVAWRDAFGSHAALERTARRDVQPLNGADPTQPEHDRPRPEHAHSSVFT